MPQRSRTPVRPRTTPRYPSTPPEGSRYGSPFYVRSPPRTRDRTATARFVNRVPGQCIACPRTAVVLVPTGHVCLGHYWLTVRLFAFMHSIVEQEVFDNYLRRLESNSALLVRDLRAFQLALAGAFHISRDEVLNIVLPSQRARYTRRLSLILLLV